MVRGPVTQVTRWVSGTYQRLTELAARCPVVSADETGWPVRLGGGSS